MEPALYLTFHAKCTVSKDRKRFSLFKVYTIIHGLIKTQHGVRRQTVQYQVSGFEHYPTVTNIIIHVTQPQLCFSSRSGCYHLAPLAPFQI